MNPVLQNILMKILVGTLAIATVIVLIFFVWLCLYAFGVIQPSTFI